MTYSDQFNIRSRFVKFNDVADAIDGLITRQNAPNTTGTSSAYAISPLPTWDSVPTGSFVVFVPHLTNGSNATLTVNNIGPSPLLRGGVAISAGTMLAGVPYLCLYNGIGWEVLSSTEVPASRFLPITLDQINNRVGINRTTPAAALDVQGSVTYSGDANVAAIFRSSLVAGSDAGISIGSINGNTPYIAATKLNAGTGGATGLAFRTGNATRLFIRSDGNVGIGNTNPESALIVTGGVNVFPSQVGVHIGTSSNYSLIKLANSTGSYIDFGPATGSNDYRARILWNASPEYFQVVSGGDLEMYSHGLKRATFNTAGLAVHGEFSVASGALFVGSTTHNGQIYINNNNPTVYFQDTNNRSCMIHCNSGILYFLRGDGNNSTTWNPMPNGNWPMTLNLESADVSINGSLTLAGAFYMPHATHGAFVDGSSRRILFIENHELLELRAGVAVRFTNISNGSSLTATGVSNTGALFKISSSIRYKTDIENIENQYIDKLLDLRPVWYRPNTETTSNANPDWSYYGLIAEEVAEVEPRLVAFNYSEEDVNSETGQVSVDAILEPESVDYARLSVLLLGMVQRHHATIEAIEQRLAVLESKVE